MKISSKNIKQFTVFLLLLILISSSAVYLITRVFESKNIHLPWFISLPSVPGVYYLLFIVFDRWVWKSKLGRFLSGIKSPDLNGTWAGKGKSSFDKFKSEFDAKLVIEQTATSVIIRGQFVESKSISLNAGFEPSDIDGCDALFYFFRNIPNPDAQEEMAMHEGSAKLVYDPEEKIIRGIYYSGRDRHNHGTLELKRKV